MERLLNSNVVVRVMRVVFIISTDMAVTGASELMPTYTFGFGEAVKAFFGWMDDALVYIMR